MEEFNTLYENQRKSNLPVIKPLDQKNNLQEIQWTKGPFKLHHRDSINKIQKVINNPISSINESQEKKGEKMKGSL